VFAVEIKPSEIEKIKSAAENIGEPFYSWIYERYSSRDGFISHMPYTKAGYLEALSSEGATLSKAVCMYLMYIFEQYASEFELGKYVYQNELVAKVLERGSWDSYVCGKSKRIWNERAGESPKNIIKKSNLNRKRGIVNG
jgi:hypothetical protein